MCVFAFCKLGSGSKTEEEVRDGQNRREDRKKEMYNL